MPYTTEWVDPEIFLVHKGFVVYHVYKNDDVDQGPRTYWFTTDPEKGEGYNDIIDPSQDFGPFDARTLPTAEGVDFGDEDEVRDLLIAAIESGHIRPNRP